MATKKETELDKLAKKNQQQKYDAIRKKQKIKLHNIKAAAKAHRADPDREDHWWHGKKPTEKSKSLSKEHRKTKKSMESFDKQSDKLDEHGVWSKYNKKGDAFASYEKRKLLEKGFPSKAKMDLDVNRPDFPKKPTYGGTTKKTYANAYKKKNK